MPMFDYKCPDCQYKQQHFLAIGAGFEKVCPKCGSEKYARKFGMFKSSVEYSNQEEHMAKVIEPAVAEIYSQIGKEALDDDAGTLENIFGDGKVKDTFAEKDD